MWASAEITGWAATWRTTTCEIELQKTQPGVKDKRSGHIFPLSLLVLPSTRPMKGI